MKPAFSNEIGVLLKGNRTVACEIEKRFKTTNKFVNLNESEGGKLHFFIIPDLIRDRHDRRRLNAFFYLFESERKERT